MTILHADLIGAQADLIMRIASIKEPLGGHGDILTSSDLPQGLIFNLGLELLEALWSITNKTDTFDPYFGAELSTPVEIYSLVGDCMEWSGIIARIDDAGLLQARNNYFFSEYYPAEATVAVFRADLIETLLFLSGKLIEVARNGFTVCISEI